MIILPSLLPPPRFCPTSRIPVIFKASGTRFPLTLECVARAAIDIPAPLRGETQGRAPLSPAQLPDLGGEAGFGVEWPELSALRAQGDDS